MQFAVQQKTQEPI